MRYLLTITLLFSLVAIPGTANAEQATAEPKQKTETSDQGFVPLFDGESIDQWVQRGGKAEYEVVDGMIVGTAVRNSPNSFLCTPRDYSDFILELDLKCDKGLNSGIMIRAQASDEPYTAKGIGADGQPWERNIAADRVHGYQVEIDHGEDRRWSGGIYDEARRGWINDLKGDDKEAARQAFKFYEWNHYKIECRGDKIRTWVNGVPAADLTDDADASGFIGLQVHGVYKPEDAGLQVRWKNLRIKEL